MRSICLYFQVHQPFRLRTYRFFDIGADHYYYDDYQNRRIVRRIANNCYIPANEVLLALISEYGSAFKVTFSISGTAIEQFKKYTPEVIESFKRLAKTGNVEFLAETYSHSLVGLNDPEEFKRQVEEHAATIQELFGVTPTAFRNTELVYSNGIADQVFRMGYKTMLTEGAKQLLGWKSPNYLYFSSPHPRMKILLRNYQLSDDIAFRFSQQSWNEWPLTAEKYVSWLDSVDPKQDLVNLFMDYETIGEHQKAESGIFGFLRAFPEQLIRSQKWTFRTPSEVADELQPVAGIDCPHAISWADEERDLTAWLGNDLQQEAFTTLYKLSKAMATCTDPDLHRDWNYLQASDHFYYMCTKWFSDGDVHQYFTPYGTPYEAFLNYMNVLSDFMIRVNEYTEKQGPLENIIPAKIETEAEVGIVTEVKPSTAKAPKTKGKTVADTAEKPGTNTKKAAKKG
ncbi:MAG: glycoside hydrolase family 57 protein [Bacteroidales bacterium]